MIGPGRIVLYLVLIVAAFLFGFPFYWMAASALRPLSRLYELPIQLLVRHPTLDNFEVIITGHYPGMISQLHVAFGRSMLNSLIIALTSMILTVGICSLAGFSFAKHRFKGRDALFVFMLATVMIPGAVGLVPSYVIMAWFHWLNTWWPLIIPGIAPPIGIFWMRQYIATLPDELLDAARIDGASEVTIFAEIVFPLARPAVGALAIFVFLGSWNNLLSPLIYLSSERLFTFPVVLALLQGEFTGHGTPVNLILAGSVLSVLPTLALFVFLQRTFVSGLTLGSIST